MKKFQDHGILFESMVYPGAKHGISGEQAQFHVYKTLFDFFERKLTVVE
jgi:dipeptidyl-peptidase-4